MSFDYYEWRTSKGPLTIEKNQQSGFWDLRLNGIPIQQGYVDPDQAASDANASEFGLEAKNSILKGLHIPWELKQWSNSKLRQSERNNQNN